MTPAPTIIRRSCAFTAEETPSAIKARIATTKAQAIDLAWYLGIKRPHVSYVYAPNDRDDLNATIGRPCANTWSEALAQCHYGRYAQFTIIVRNQDYLDTL